jgi:hypothetical protein
MKQTDTGEKGKVPGKAAKRKPGSLSHAAAIVVLAAVLGLFTTPASGQQTAIGPDTINGISTEGYLVWMATTGGVVCLNTVDDTWVLYAREQGIPGNVITSVAVDPDGNRWMGTPAGAAMFDGSRWRIFTRADGLLDDDVRSIAVDRSGVKWFATAGGLTRYDGRTWTAFPMQEIVRRTAQDSGTSRLFSFKGREVPASVVSSPLPEGAPPEAAPSQPVSPAQTRSAPSPPVTASSVPAPPGQSPGETQAMPGVREPVPEPVPGQAAAVSSPTVPAAPPAVPESPAVHQAPPGRERVSEDRPPDVGGTTVQAGTSYTVLIGVYPSRQKAFAVASEFRKKGDDAFTSEALSLSGVREYQVLMGTFGTPALARDKARELRQRRFRRADVVSRRYTVQVVECGGFIPTEEARQALVAMGHMPYESRCRGYGQRRILLGAHETLEAVERAVLEVRAAFPGARSALR